MGDISGNASHDAVEGLIRQANLSTLSLSPRRPTGATSTGTGSTATTRPRRAARYTLDEQSFQRHAQQERDNDDAQEPPPFTLVDRMRNWRNDAMTQHLYGTAEFWGSKVFEMTSEHGPTTAGPAHAPASDPPRLRPDNPDDAFWLAQTHFLTHKYAQAERVLTAVRPSLSQPSSSSGNGGRLTDTSLACRYLAAQCQVRLGKWEEALDMVGRQSYLGVDSYTNNQGDGGIRVS